MSIESLTTVICTLLVLAAIAVQTAYSARTQNPPPPPVAVVEPAPAQVRAGAKPHRHQWVFRSEEETNKVNRRIHVCKVNGCFDTFVEEVPQTGVGDG